MMWWPVLTAIMIGLTLAALSYVVFHKHEKWGGWDYTIIGAAGVVLPLIFFAIIGNAHWAPTDWVEQSRYELITVTIDGRSEYVTRLDAGYDDYYIYFIDGVPSYSAQSAEVDESRFYLSENGEATVIRVRQLPQGWFKLISWGGRDYRSRFYLPGEVGS